MSNLDVVRAWKDPEYRATLGDAIPEHPAGQIELADPGLDRGAAVGRGPFFSGMGGCATSRCTLTHGFCCH